MNTRDYVRNLPPDLRRPVRAILIGTVPVTVFGAIWGYLGIHPVPVPPFLSVDWKSLPAVASGSLGWGLTWLSGTLASLLIELSHMAVRRVRVVPARWLDHVAYFVPVLAAALLPPPYWTAYVHDVSPCLLP